MGHDEEAELTHYVLRHHGDMLTGFEHAVLRAAWAREEFQEETGTAVAAHLMARYGRSGDRRIDEALAGGVDTFRRSTSRRILAENPGLRIHRCPRCDRVLRTPRAEQCFQCGHDWHTRDACLP